MSAYYALARHALCGAAVRIRAIVWERPVVDRSCGKSEKVSNLSRLKRIVK